MMENSIKDTEFADGEALEFLQRWRGENEDTRLRTFKIRIVKNLVDVTLIDALEYQTKGEVDDNLMSIPMSGRTLAEATLRAYNFWRHAAKERQKHQRR